MQCLLRCVRGVDKDNKIVAFVGDHDHLLNHLLNPPLNHLLNHLLEAYTTIIF